MARSINRKDSIMLTYDMSEAHGPMYKYLYECIKRDIEEGRIAPMEKMPSKRNLASNLGISTITAENAYNQLIDEGYLEARPRRGYFAADISPKAVIPAPAFPTSRFPISEKADGHVHAEDDPPKEDYWFSFSSNRIPSRNFPFSVWAKLGRRTLSGMEQELLAPSPFAGVLPLREAIAGYLAAFRGMNVDPDQIFVGAGTEYLYDMLVKLLGTDKTYCIENPGYKKLEKIYKSCGADCRPVDMDENGILVPSLLNRKAQVAHISPTHHFPTGITMPVARRYELLAWANGAEDRYIIEDDYDSEFRLTGSMIPSLQSLDAGRKVIYMNTFSKSLSSTIRISYMVLPADLADRYYKELGFFSCTVPNIQQYTLAAFISEGYFEKYINRMRLYYKNERKAVLKIIAEVLGARNCRVMENHAGLHFLLELKTGKTDAEIKRTMREKGIRIEALSDFYMDGKERNMHRFILNYSNMDLEKLKKAVETLRKTCLA